MKSLGKTEYLDYIVWDIYESIGTVLEELGNDDFAY